MPVFPIMIGDKNTNEWVEHPRFKGILLKKLLTSNENSLASVNVVQVPPSCQISEHTHIVQVETIYVIAGRCVLTVNGVDVPFNAGQIVAVPAALEHALRNAGAETVELLTIFTPPQ